MQACERSSFSKLYIIDCLIINTFMRRLFNVIFQISPILLLPYFHHKPLQMQQPHSNISPLFQIKQSTHIQSSTTHTLSQVEPNPKQNEAEQQKDQKTTNLEQKQSLDEQKAKSSNLLTQFQTNAQNNLSSENMIQSEVGIESDEKEVLPDVKEEEAKRVDTHIIQQNQAFISEDCPSYFKQYLERRNFKVVKRTGLQKEIQLKNSNHQIRVFKIDDLQKQGLDQLQIISNFLNPPHHINTLNQAKQFINCSEEDSFLIVSYIPEREVYEKQMQDQIKSSFDDYTASHKKDLQKLEADFNEMKYSSSSNRNCFLVVRTKEVADFLKLSSSKLGVPYLMWRSHKYSGNESNACIDGIKFTIASLEKEMKKSLPLGEVINHTTHLYINHLNSEAEVENKVRQMQMSKDPKKILLVKTNEQRPEFQESVDHILQTVARLNRHKVVVIKTENDSVLTKIFHIQPDPFATIRLIDVNQNQSTLFGKYDTGHYSRSFYQGPFKIENLSTFLNQPTHPQYYQNKKKLTELKPMGINQLSNQKEVLVLFEKNGCEGCQYMEETLGELKKIIKVLNQGKPKMKEQTIYKYKIQVPEMIKSIKIRRYNILNEDLQVESPSTTPRLCITLQGKLIDLKVEATLARLAKVKNEKEARQVHDQILSELIDNIRKAKESFKLQNDHK